MNHLRLILCDGNTETQVSVLEDVFIIGRLPECNLFLPFGGVSRKHARITKTTDSTWIIEDMNSKNGTTVNDDLVNSAKELYQNDIIKLGNTTLVVDFPTETEQLESHDLENSEKWETEDYSVTILRNVYELQKQWIDAKTVQDSNSKDKSINRLKDLVEIAKNLSAATSIEAIFPR